MIDPDGEEWLTVSEAARRVRVNPGTIRVWAHRNKVRSYRTGRDAYVNIRDVQEHEHRWRSRQ